MRDIVIFFDIGGTLTDSPDIFEVITRKLVGHWPDEATYNLVLKTYKGTYDLIRKEPPEYPFRSIVDIHKSSLKYLATQHGYPDISSQAGDIQVDVYVHRSSFFPEVRPLLTKLSRSGVKMVIASDNDNVGLNYQITKFGLDRYFSGYCISETARAYKPMYGFIANLKKYLPINLNDCYFVGDSWVDIESGKRLGIKSVHINRKHVAKVEGADYTINNLKELLPILNMK